MAKIINFILQFVLAVKWFSASSVLRSCKRKSYCGLYRIVKSLLINYNITTTIKDNTLITVLIIL